MGRCTVSIFKTFLQCNVRLSVGKILISHFSKVVAHLSNTLAFLRFVCCPPFRCCRCVELWMTDYSRWASNSRSDKENRQQNWPLWLRSSSKDYLERSLHVLSSPATGFSLDCRAFYRACSSKESSREIVQTHARWMVQVRNP